MSLRWRGAGAVILVVAVAMSILFVAATTFGLRLARQRDVRDTVDDVRSAKLALRMQLHELQTTAMDWGVWDDTYEFVGKGSPAYVASNLDDSALPAAGVSAMVFVDRRGRVVFAKAVEPESDEATRVPPALLGQSRKIALASAKSQEDTSVVGFLPAGDSTLMIASQAILRSDESGPPIGTLVMAKAISAEEIGVLEELTGAVVAITSIESTAADRDVAQIRGGSRARSTATVVTQPARDKLTGYSWLTAVDGTPAAILRVGTTSHTLQAISTFVDYSYIGLIALGLVMALSLAVMLEGPVVSRLSRLQKELDQATSLADPSYRVTVDGRDELREIASSVNSMLEAIERSEREQRELLFLAAHDPLTGLVNRRRFEEEFRRELAETDRLGDSGALLWIDVDHFKHINDTLGHSAGDDVLVGFAELLRRQTRSYNTLSRVGGDEFAVILPHADERTALQAANRLCMRLAEEEFRICGKTMHVTCSIGVVEYPKDGASVDDAMEHADVAMYAAKERGRACVQVYSALTDESGPAVAGIDWAAKITGAMRDGRLALHAMPTRHVSDGVSGPFELLLRMTEPDGREIQPNAILAAAEHSGLIGELDRWVIHRAIKMLELETAEDRDTSFSVNVSASALSDTDLLASVGDDLAATGVDPSRLIFEIEEAAALVDVPRAQRFILGIKELGCRVTLDGFGSGASNFLYLRRLPVDFLKIDGVLVRSLRTAAADRYFIRAIVEMCRGLDIQTVAEYVEDEDLLRAVSDQGVDFAQGYEIGEAEPIDVFVTPRDSTEPGASA